LIVEDELSIALDLERAMADLGYEVCLAASESKARSLAMQDHPDIVLMDVCLGREGIETGRWLRAVCGTSVVFVTSDVDPNTVQRIREQVPGAPVVSKPVNRDSLARAVQAAGVPVQAIPHIQSKRSPTVTALQCEDAVLRQDRVIIGITLLVLIQLAWLYVLRLAGSVAIAGTNVTELFLMWSVMMVAMMLPSATPMVLFYARVGRKAAIDVQPFTPTGWFAAGYLLVWFGFALAATGAQWALERAALLTPAMEGTSNVVGGILLIMAGLYQWSPVKDTCRAHCQAPMLFIQSNGGFRRNVLGALEIGVWHGTYCLGCCWVLMTLLFVGGVMNVLWITAIAILVFVEKAVGGRLVSRAAGVGLIFGGIWLLMR
jgi:predicted metal-binding membrane protein/CheY-like chemotaxis protein